MHVVSSCNEFLYLLVDLLGGLSVAEGHGGHVFQDGHLHRAVPAVQQRHQWTGVHGPVHYRRPDACTERCGSGVITFSPRCGLTLMQDVEWLLGRAQMLLLRTQFLINDT